MWILIGMCGSVTWFQVLMGFQAQVFFASVGPKAFETNQPEAKGFQRVKALAKYLLLFCIGLSFILCL